MAASESFNQELMQYELYKVFICKKHVRQLGEKLTASKLDRSLLLFIEKIEDVNGVYFYSQALVGEFIIT